jgi:hypothetical protein
MREEESSDRLARERRKMLATNEQSRRERVARQEKVMQEKQTKEQLAKEQVRTKVLAREKQERHTEQDQEMPWAEFSPSDQMMIVANHENIPYRTRGFLPGALGKF